MALITIVFHSTYVDQDDLPVVSSWTRRHLGSGQHTESRWVEWPWQYALGGHFEVLCLTTWRQGSSSGRRSPKESIAKSILSLKKDVLSSLLSGVMTKMWRKPPGIVSSIPTASRSSMRLKKRQSSLERVLEEVDCLHGQPRSIPVDATGCIWGYQCDQDVPWCLQTLDGYPTT